MKEFGRFKIASGVIAFLLVLTVNSQLSAQSSEWAIKMFSETGAPRLHDFGSVALHSNVEHRFQFKNVYDSDVVISSVSSNCGCTKASASKSLIRPGETGEIIARVDTSGREHTKARKATIRVLFSKPAIAEVQLQVKTYIRPDVGFEPGQIELGTVPYGETVVKKAFLQYEGRPDWALVRIQKNNPGIKAEAREVRRQGGGVLYEIQVELKSDASPGYIDDLLRFQTNDRDTATSSIFLPIKGLVVEPLSVKPSFLQLGVVTQGSKVSKNLVVSGSEPFKILSVSSDDKRFKFIKTDLTRSVHVVPVAFEAGSRLGSFAGSITIKISRSSEGEGEDVQETTIETLGVVVEEVDSNVGIPQATSTEDEEGDEVSEETRTQEFESDLEFIDDGGDLASEKSVSKKNNRSDGASLESKVVQNDVKHTSRTILTAKNEPQEETSAEGWKPVGSWRRAPSSDKSNSSSNVRFVASLLDNERL